MWIQLSQFRPPPQICPIVSGTHLNNFRNTIIMKYIILCNSKGFSLWCFDGWTIARSLSKVMGGNAEKNYAKEETDSRHYLQKIISDHLRNQQTLGASTPSGLFCISGRPEVDALPSLVAEPGLLMSLSTFSSPILLSECRSWKITLHHVAYTCETWQRTMQFNIERSCVFFSTVTHFYQTLST